MSDTTWVWLTGDNHIPIADDWHLRSYVPVKAVRHEADGSTLLIEGNEYKVEGSDFLVPAPDWAVGLHLLGIEFRVSWRRNNDDPIRIGSLRPYWTAEQWVDLMSKEGRWLGHCCSTISAMRDLVFSARREDGWFSAEDWIELVALMQEHDGFMEMFEPGFPLDKPEPNLLDDDLEDPWVQVVKAWPMVKDRMEIRRMDKAEDVTYLDDAISALNHGMRMLDYRFLFRAQELTEENFPHATQEERDRRNMEAHFDEAKSTHTILLRFLPALHTIHAKISELYPEPLEGYAAILTVLEQWVDVPHPDDPSRTKREKVPVAETDRWGHGILMVRSGLAIYPDMESMDRTIEIWKSSDPDIESKIKVVPVRVSVEEGIVLGEPE